MYSAMIRSAKLCCTLRNTLRNIAVYLFLKLLRYLTAKERYVPCGVSQYSATLIMLYNPIYLYLEAIFNLNIRQENQYDTDYFKYQRKQIPLLYGVG